MSFTDTQNIGFSKTSKNLEGANNESPSPKVVAQRLADANAASAAFIAREVAHARMTSADAQWIADNTRFDIPGNPPQRGEAAAGGGGPQAPLGRITKLVDQNPYQKALEDFEIEQENAARGRRRKWRIQDAAASLLKGTKQDRVCSCKRSIIYGAQGVSCDIIEESSAKWGNLVSCGNIWTCPACSAVISSLRADEANQALAWARQPIKHRLPNGRVMDRTRATPVMMTLTARHGRRDDLCSLIDNLLNAKRMMFQSDLWKKLRVELIKQPVFLKEVGKTATGQPVYNETLDDTGVPCLVERKRTTVREPIFDPITGQFVLNPDGTQKTRKKSVKPYTAMVQKQRATGWKTGSGKVVGVIVAFEITHTQAGGWHPHFHIAVFLDTSTEAQAKKILSPLRKVWLHCLKSNGLYAKGEVGFRVDGAKQVGNYLAKFGAGTGIELSDERKCLADAKAAQDWGLVEELTAARAKKPKKPGAGATPWQLLEQYTFPDERIIEDRKDLTPKRAGALFIEFAQTFHGKQQLQWSSGLKDLVGISEQNDEEIMEASEEREKRSLSVVAPEDWHHLCSFTTRLQRNEFLIGMEMKDADVFWTEFEGFLGRAPIRTVDEAWRAGESITLTDRQAIARATKAGGP